MLKNYILIACWWLLPLLLFGQSQGVDGYGNNHVSGNFFINQHGDSCIYPRLDRFGDLLYYPPLVATDSALLQGATGMKCYGHANFDGWSTITSRGFEYSLSSNFSTCTRIPIGNGLGNFQTIITGLAYNQNYYVRAFAANAYGTSYGEKVSVRTEIGEMILGPMTATNVQSTSVQVRIPIVENGGAQVSGQICVYDDSMHHVVVQCVTIYPTAATAISATIQNLPAGSDYYIETVLSNTLTVDTLTLKVHCPTDLRISIAEAVPLVTYPCHPSVGKTYNFVAQITGTDPQKSQYQCVWLPSIGEIEQEDTLAHITVTGTERLSVTAYLFLGADTVRSNTLLFDVDATRNQASYMVCVEEFANYASSRTVAMLGVAWLNEYGDTVSTESSVKVPTGTYTFKAVDGYGCYQDTVLFIGPKVRHCILDSLPRAGEYAHLEGETWILDSIHDQEGNNYLVKQFGEQCWMRQNLRSVYAPDGFYLAHSAQNERRAYFFGLDSGPERAFQYGLRYSWGAALNSTYIEGAQVTFADNHRGVCPEGWHIPSYAECVILTENVIYERFSNADIQPPAVVTNQLIGRNTPVGVMLGKSCYYDYTNRNFDESLIDCSELSLTINGSTADNPLDYAFWLTDNENGFIGYAFTTKAAVDYGIMKRVVHRKSYRAVRCLRNP